jgi:putative salt-induced outer membrane protein YdiY
VGHQPLRGLPAPLQRLGRELIATAKNQLNVELGGGFVNEQRILPPRAKFGTGRAYSKYTRVLSPTANFNQDAEYLHNFKNKDGYRVTTNTALVASITTHVSMKFGYQWKFINQPATNAAGQKFGKSDTLASAALIVNY